MVSIDAAPPSIAAVEDVSNAGANVNAASPAKPGDKLKLLVRGLAAAGTEVAPGRVRVTAGGRVMPAGQVSPVSSSTYTVQFTLDPSIAAGAQVPLTVTIDGKTSLPVYIPIT